MATVSEQSASVAEVPRPRVSVIVLNWNGREHAEECLRSLSNLRYERDRLEVILFDNGSSDGSVEYLAERFPDVKLVASDRNLGFAEGNNRAALSASHEWLAFLNNDARVPPDWLQRLSAPLRKEDPPRCIGGTILSWDGETIDFAGGTANVLGYGFQVGYGEPASHLDASRLSLFACGGAMLIERALFLEVGGFDPDYFLFFEDVDLGWRLNLLGHDVWYEASAVAYHHHHASVRAIPDSQRQALYGRNALWTILKCLDDRNLWRVLPMALVLQAERALVAVPPEVRQFNFEPERARLEEHVSEAAPDPLPSALSPLLAITAFADKLEAMWERRAWLQRHRVRADREIFRLLNNPFETDVGDSRYLLLMRRMASLFGVDEQLP
jgi:GT2 family glycosyltransferase